MTWDGRIIAISAIAAVGLLGFIRKLYLLSLSSKDYEVVGSYRQKFLEYVENESSNAPAHEEFNYLIKHSERVQVILGGFGVISSFKPPYSQVIYKRYSVILNAIPEINSLFNNHPLSGFRTSNDLTDSYIRIVDNCLVRYGGASEYKIELIKSDLKNPLKWLVEGIRLSILPVPYLLKTFGLVSSGTADRIANSLIARLFSLFIFLVGAVSSLVTVVIGWDDFHTKFIRLIHNF